MRGKIICVVLLLLFAAIVIPPEISAEIISVSHPPDVVYSTDVVVVSAVLTGSDSLVALHWQVDGGPANTYNMTNSSSELVFVAAIPAQAIGSTVDYWVTSVNGNFSDRFPSTGTHSYYVFSPDAPDLVLDENSILFTPLDPTQPPYMNETNVTNIYITVWNIGQGGVSNIRVRVYDGDVPIWNGMIISLAGHGNYDSIHFPWRPDEGEYDLMFMVDPDDEIIEINENNNDYSTDSITVYPAPPTPIVEESTDDMTGLIPFILIPIIFLLLLLFFMSRKKTINVRVTKVKKFTSARDRSTRYKLTCGYGSKEEPHVLGVAKSTDLRADVGDVIKVAPVEVVQNEEGELAWKDAEVIKHVPDEEPTLEGDIRKLVKKQKE